jgi:hypothetical protein
MRNMVLVVTAATAIVSAGPFLSAARAADLYPEAQPPVAEAPPPEVAPPVAVVPRPPAVVLVEPPCPLVWRCGYWGCGWRQACGPVGPEVYVGPPRWGYYGAYRGYRGHYWGHDWGHHWGYRRHWG